MIMKTLSLQEPWASLITFREKCIETRGYRTKYRGWILIHASMGLKLWNVVEDKRPFREAFIRHDSNCIEFPLGKIIGLARIVDCVPTGELISKTSVRELTFGNYSAGRYGWKLEGAARFKHPIAAKGCLYLWDFDLSGLHPEDMALVESSVA